MEIIRKKNKTGRGPVIRKERDLVYLTFPSLEESGVVDHLFSTRLGGVSQGYVGSMNLSYHRGDEKENVDENFRRIGELLGRGVEDFVFTDQTHTTHVKIVTEDDRGKGMVREQDYTDVDGLITDRPGIVLSAFFADCVPLFFVDPVRKAVGLSHSGWKGTVGKIGKVTVEAMERAYGCRPADMIAAIGPSICGDCYEVGEDVAEQFRETFLPTGQRADGKLLTEKRGGKYMLDLWEANRRILEEAGIPGENISVTDLCTCCNPDFLFSHRASKGKRGNLGAFLVLR